jgi:putative hydrolase of the HAD superfamily
MTQPALAAVFIDAGYTLVYDQPSFEETCAEFINCRGVEADLAAMQSARSRSQEALECTLRRPDLYTHDARVREMWSAYFGDLIAAGAPTLAADAQVLGGAVFDVYNPGPRWAPYPDVVEALTMLRASGFRLHIASDWSRHLAETMQMIGLDSFFDAYHVSTLMGITKNSPKFYTAVLRKSKLSPHQAIMVGDSCLRDVQIPRAAGMTAFLIDRSRRQTGSADSVFPDLLSAARHIAECYTAR